jgi:replicative DNA helicase
MPLKGPADDSAERACLGAMIGKPDLIPLAEERIPSPEAFHDVRHQVIFTAIRNVFRAGDGMDWITIAADLTRIGEIHRFKGRLQAEDYIKQLANDCPSFEGIEDYAKLVRDAWHRRLAIEALRNAAVESGDLNKDLAGSLGRLTNDATKLIVAADYKPPSMIGDVARKVVDDHVDRKDVRRKLGERLPGLSTPWPLLNFMLAGLRPGQLILIGARPGDGKTTIALNVADHIAETLPDRIEHGTVKPGFGGVYIFSLEMLEYALGEKFVFTRANVDSRTARTASTNDDEDARIEAAGESLNHKRIFLDDTVGLTWSQIRARAYVARERLGIECFIIDYIQKIEKEIDPATGRKLDQTPHVTQLAIGAKNLAKQLWVPVICLAQLNRGVDLRRGKDRAPVKADLRDSGFLEQEADVVGLLWPKRAMTNQAGDTPTDLIIAKQREGPEGTVPMQFLKTTGRFVEAIEQAQPGEKNDADYAAFHEREREAKTEAGPPA